MSYAATLEESAPIQLISSFFAMNKLEQTIENIIFELDLLPHLAQWQHKPASICGLILDCVSSLAGHKCSGHFDLTEYEINILTQTFPHRLRVIAKIDLDLPPHAGFCCQVFALQNHANQLIAESHGTLLLRSSN
jgi:hypothetical protein